MWVWLRLTIMKLARRKNMMSIKGMISIRACFLGMGDRILMVQSLFEKLILRTAHGEGDGCANSRDGARFKTPPSKRTRGRVIQNWAPGALRHLRARDAAAARIHRHHTHAATGDLGTASLIRIFRTRSADGDRFC